MKAKAQNTGSSRRTPILGVLAVALLAGSGYYLWTQIAPHTVADDANTRMFICSETLKPFKHSLTVGETEPILSPFTKKNTGWRAEPCYWTKDGKAKKNPTWVLVKARMGLEGKTMCPECGHEVVVHNADSQRTMPSKELMDAAE